MLSKISLFNSEIFKQLGRSVGWIGLIYFLTLIFIIPLNIILTLSNEHQVYYFHVDGLFNLNFEIQQILIAILPILLAVFIMRFLHQKKYVDLMHCLPIKREFLFHQYIFGGVFFLIVPVLCTGIITLILYYSKGLHVYFTIQDIFIWLGITILYNVVFYMIGVLVGVLTGISFIQVVLSYILLFFPVGVLFLLFFNMTYLVHGFPRDNLVYEKIDYLSPIVYFLFQNQQQTTSWNIFIAYFLVSIIAYAFSLYIYKKRKLEMASQAIAFTKLKSIFKYGTTFCTMLLGGLYFGEVQGETGWILFGYFLGATLGYFVAEMVLLKTWRVFGKIRGLIIYVGIIIILGFITPISFSAYENYIPEEDDIKNVQVLEYLISDHYPKDQFVPQKMNGDAIIKRVRSLHEQLISTKKRYINKRVDDRPIYIEYNLKSGKEITRQYFIPKEDFPAILKPIYESKEFKIVNNQVFHIDEKNVDKITFTSSGPVDKNVSITNPNEITELIHLFRQEILEENYNPKQGSYNGIEIMLNNNRSLYLEFKPTYKKVETWLQQKGLFEDATLTSDDVSYVLVSKREDLNINLYEDDSNMIAEKMKKNTDTLKITNKREITDLLDSFFRYEINDPYIVVYYFKDTDIFEVRTFTQEEAPEFILNQIK